jgi:hypothetical protein
MEVVVDNDPGTTILVTPETVLPAVASVDANVAVPGVFLGMRHRDHSDEEATDPEERLIQNKKRRKTSNIINTLSAPQQNVILPLQGLVAFIKNNFYCKECRRLSSTCELELETIGIASSLLF